MSQLSLGVILFPSFLRGTTLFMRYTTFPTRPLVACLHQGANALLPVLHGGIPANDTHLSHDSVAEPCREDVKGGGGDGEIAIGKSCVVPEEAEDWETADDRMEACLQGGVSLTSLDISSPLLSSKFVER